MSKMANFHRTKKFDLGIIWKRSNFLQSFLILWSPAVELQNILEPQATNYQNGHFYGSKKILLEIAAKRNNFLQLFLVYGHL